MGIETSSQACELHLKADKIRLDVIRVALQNRQGHIAPSLSCVDILVALFYQVMGPADKFILSKSHGGYGYYAILADKGIMPRWKWERFDLPGCVERMPEYGIIAGCGALGHGLPMATGLAYSRKLMGLKANVFCLIGDGEMQEGSNWEALQFAKKHNLDNLVLIVDDNGLQAIGPRTDIMDEVENDLDNRISGFGIYTVKCDGHDADCIATMLKAIIPVKKPKALLATTIKGYGMPCAEGNAHFHYRLPACIESLSLTH